MLQFRCPSCRKKLRLDVRFAGKSVRCSVCGTTFTAPQSEDVEQQEGGRRDGEQAPPAEEDHVPLAKSHFSIDHDELIDMTAMVDIVFFLLIFFLVTSMQALDSAIAMPTPGKSPDQPKGAASQASSPSSLDDFEDDDEYIVVHIGRDNQLEIDGVVLNGIADLVGKLHELRASPTNPSKLLVVGHGYASHGTMVEVLDAGHDAGLDSVRMAVSNQEED